MVDFLEKVATNLIEKHPDDLDKVTVLVPSKRSSLFLNKFLSQHIDGAFIAPRSITWQDFLEEHSGYVQLDNLGLTFLLYETYLETEMEPESFEVFNRWSSIILSDFNEIDNYLLDAKTVFKNLKNIKDIENWSFNSDDLSEMQQDFNSFYENLGVLYEAFQNKLDTKKLAYPGKLKKLVWDKSPTLVEQQGYTYWIGFYAIAPAEQRIIDLFLDKQMGYVYWDADDYYIDNQSHLAGDFFRKSIELKKKKYNWVQNNIDQQKDITVHQVPGHVFQCTVANDIIKDLPVDNTALILADEDLLIPTLENLDSSLEDFNVSMQIPLNKSPFILLLDELINLHENAHKSIDYYGEYKFYHKNIISFLNNSVISFDHESNSSKSYHLDRALFSVSELNSLLSKLSLQGLIPIFKPVKDIPTDIFSRIQSLIDFLKYKINSDERDAYYSEMLFKSTQFFQQLINYCDAYPYIDNASSLRKIIQMLCREQQLEFFGEPLKGLQIIGMLESRALDFKHIVLVGCNEGILPNTKPKPSFMPFDLKKQLGLPTRKEYESIFAYYFYRLFQRSENIHLIYNIKDSPMSAAEQSRFISQLQFERSFDRFKSDIKVINHGVKSSSKLKENIIIEKSNEIVEILKNDYLKRISASSLNNYLACPLNFYFDKVAKFERPDELEEKLEARTFGNITHKILENLFKPFVGKGAVKTEDIKKMIGSVEKEYENAIQDLRYQKLMETAYNQLAKEAIVAVCKKQLKKDLKLVKDKQLKIISLEEKLTAEIELGKHKVRLLGYIDRIDELDGIPRIIDYKTGTKKASDLSSYKSELNRDTLKSKKEITQLLFYYLLYSKNYQGKNPKPGIYSTVTKDLHPFEVRLGRREIDDEMIQEFKVVLEEVIDEMLSLEIAFEHDKNAKYCDFCVID